MGKIIDFELNENKYEIFIPSCKELIQWGKDNNFDNPEAKYYESMSTFVSSPYDLIAQLDDAGIDCESITCFDLFTMFCGANLIDEFLKLTIKINGNDFKEYELMKNTENEEIILYNYEYEQQFNAEAFNKIFDIICEEFNIKNRRKTRFANKLASK